MCPNQAELSAPRVDATQASDWMSKCLMLASSWDINTDVLRRHQICELYTNGYDRLAEEVIAAPKFSLKNINKISSLECYGSQ